MRTCPQLRRRGRSLSLDVPAGETVQHLDLAVAIDQLLQTLGRRRRSIGLLPSTFGGMRAESMFTVEGVKPGGWNPVVTVAESRSWRTPTARTT